MSAWKQADPTFRPQVLILQKFALEYEACYGKARSHYMHVAVCHTAEMWTRFGTLLRLRYVIEYGIIVSVSFFFLISLAISRLRPRITITMSSPIRSRRTVDSFPLLPRMSSSTASQASSSKSSLTWPNSPIASIALMATGSSRRRTQSILADRE